MDEKPTFLPGPEVYVPIEADPIHHHTVVCKVCGKIVQLYEYTELPEP